MPSSSDIFQVQQVTLPDAAAINFGGGDVRHFGPDDGLSAVAIANPTRQLAARDNLLRDKINEVISVVNNKEQYINVPVPRTTLPPGGTSELITNYRIPAGFEARILNATISPSPTSLLEVLYAEGTYGASTGVQVVSTTGAPEFTAGTVFYRSGEFIVRMANNDSVAHELVASIILTMRPVGPQSGGIIGPGAVGAQGPKGDKGDIGSVGAGGPPGSAGTPGLIWGGAWASGSNYTQRDVVRYNFAGTSGWSSFVALQDNLGTPPPAPPTTNDGIWEMVAEAGMSANAGPPGPTGPNGIAGLAFVGDWSVSSPYAERDLVRYVSNYGSYQFYRTFFATAGTVPAGVNPVSNPSSWSELFGPSSINNSLVVDAVSGSYNKDSGYVSGVTANNTYLGISVVPSGSGTFGMGCREVRVLNYVGTSTQGIAWLQHRLGLNFTGKVTMYLPQKVNGASLDWTFADVVISVDAHGTVKSDSSVYTGAVVLRCPTATGNAIEIVSHGTTQSNVSISVTGMQYFVV